jgi:CheY-like chemotaxis protein
LEALGRLAGGIAHDFNNLLTAILGTAQILLEDLGPDPRRADAEEIRDAAQRAAALTNQLLAFSRRQLLQPEVLNCNELIADLQRMLRRLLSEDVELRTALAPDLGAVRADPAQLEQVVMNLAINARDAMPAGGVLTIATSNVELHEPPTGEAFVVRPGAYVKLTVTDTGTGMDDATRARIFEPFFTTKELGQGTGLGLATVYGIVKQSDGYIWVTSQAGRGSTFETYLPRVTEKPKRLERIAASGPVRGTETVLLVEDEEAVRALAARVLTSHGYTVLAAGRGDEALALAGSHAGAIHLVVADVVMPGMSGRDVLDRLRARRSDVRVLFVSGYTDEDVVRHGVLEEGAAFLAKPFTPDSLLRKVRDTLDA